MTHACGHDGRVFRLLAAPLLLGIGVFQACLAAGAPWGRACYGGAHPGVLPDRLRLTSAGAALAYTGLAAVILRRPLDELSQRRLHAALTGVFSGATVLNAISPSRVEAAVWAPTSALLAGALWAGRPSAPGRSRP